MTSLSPTPRFRTREGRLPSIYRIRVLYCRAALNRETDRQPASQPDNTDRYTDGQTDRQLGRHTGRQAGRRTASQTATKDTDRFLHHYLRKKRYQVLVADPLLYTVITYGVTVDRAGTAITLPAV